MAEKQPVEDPNYEAFIAEYIKFNSDKYVELLGLDSVQDKILRKYLSESQCVTRQLWGHKNRITRNIQQLKYNFVILKSSVITTCFKISLDSTSCIYGYMYSSQSGKKVQNNYICTGPTYRSQDGEYRSRMIPWKQFNALHVKYADEFGKVEKTILEKLESGRMEFQTDFYYPTKMPRDRNFEDSINTLRLPIRMYILCWIYDFYQIHTKTIENHVNPAYQYIIYQREDAHVLKSILSLMTREQYWVMMNHVSKYFDDINLPTRVMSEVQCGQKIFPLTVFEAIRREDINFNVWREIYISNMAANLVLNLISPSFPFINNWFYVQNAHGGLYDNISMHDKYLHSSIATDISTQLKNTDKYNYVSQDREKGAISNKFMWLSRSMQKSIVYADSNIRLTNLAVCVTSEYVGRTLRDTPMLIVHNEHIKGLDLIFTDNEIFTRHMFEYVYSFYCMNSKIGIMHGDLHMNNATINRLYFMANAKGEMYINDPHIAYVIHNTVYAFAHFGLYSTVIDFSRAIIGDYKKLEHEFSPLYADLYFKEQNARCMHIIYHYFPKIMDSYRDKIESLLVSNFPLMFKILTAIDTFVMMTNISAMFDIDDAFTKGQIKIAPCAFKILDQLAKHAEKLVIENIDAIIAGTISQPDDIEWPNLVIIKKNFSEWILTPERIKKGGINIIEIFNSNNEIVSDIDDYDSWGPLLSLNKELELRRKYKQEIDNDTKKWLHFQQTDETVEVESLTAKYEKQENEVLQFEPWMLI